MADPGMGSVDAAAGDDPLRLGLFKAVHPALQDAVSLVKGGFPILRYVYADATAEKSIERRFVEKLEDSAEVNIDAELPKGFSIPTPVGHYSPDWAIVIYEGAVRYIYFVVETKGTTESLNLRSIEKAKIDCAKKLFATLSNGLVTYLVMYAIWTVTSS